MAYEIDVAKFTVETVDDPPVSNRRQKEPNPLDGVVTESHANGAWKVLRGVSTVSNVEVTSPITHETKKVSEVQVLERMLRRAAKGHGWGLDFVPKPGQKRNTQDLYFLARDKRTPKPGKVDE